MNLQGIKMLEEFAVKTNRKKYPTVPEYALITSKYSDKTTNGLTKCVIDWINLNGYFAERVNTQGRQIDTRKTTTDVIGRSITVGSVKWIKSTSTNGSADIHAIINGRSIQIEIKCKATKDRQSEVQKQYQQRVERAGGIYLIVGTFENFYNWYFNFKGLGR